MKKRILAFLLITTTLLSCNVSKELSGAYNMINCDYSYKSMSGLTLSGINFSNKNSLSVTNVAKITSILTGTATSIPLNFTLNVDVKNPNTSAALLHGLQYIVSIDDIQFTTGNVSQSLNIASGQTQTLPLVIGVDLATLMKTNSKDAVADATKNLIGMGSKPSNVKVQLKPTFLIGSVPVTSPRYIPVNFNYGGK